MTIKIDTPAPISDWLETLRADGIDLKTLAAYQRGLVHFITWNRQSYQIDFAPAAIIQRDVVDWRSYQQTIQGARPTSINQRLAALISFFKWAVAQGLISRNGRRGEEFGPGKSPAQGLGQA